LPPGRNRASHFILPDELHIKVFDNSICRQGQKKSIVERERL
jgi:hypothetical protein